MDMSTMLEHLGRKVDENTGRIKRHSVRDKFVLAALDPKDMPEPEHLRAIIKKSIQNGIDKKIEQLNQISER